MNNVNFNPKIQPWVGAGALMGSMFGLFAMMSTPIATDACVMTCPHCGWHGVVVFAAWFHGGRLRLTFDRHPDLRDRAATCILNGTTSYDDNQPEWLTAHAGDAEVEAADREGFMRGMIFELLERNADRRDAARAGRVASPVAAAP